MVSVRKVVAGKVFDTATAELVVVIADVRRGWDDWKTEWTGLFKTANGRWLLAGK